MLKSFKNPMSFFRISKRPNTANIDLKNHEEINAKIEAFYQKSGVEVSNFVQLFNALLDYAVTSENQTGIEPTLKEGEVIVSQEEINGFKNDLALKSDKITELVSKVSEFEKKEEESFKKELLDSEALENVLLVPCTPDQKEVLECIAEWRFEENYDDVLQSPAEIVKAIVFRKSYLYNQFGAYKTGL